ncbi:MAG TPA: hypothetical protein VFE34_01435 [Dongiaceae bacterium]|jgi:hypothetical protein|nr:hypothetical protein [Dongiaceae bacterium]
MTAMVFDLAGARRARQNGERNLRHPWVPKSGPVELEDFRVGDRVQFRDGRVGIILCFGASSISGPLMALVAVNGLNYTCPITELRSAS